jgi:hypothetical protein
VGIRVRCFGASAATRLCAFSTFALRGMRCDNCSPSFGAIPSQAEVLEKLDPTAANLSGVIMREPDFRPCAHKAASSAPQHATIALWPQWPAGSIASCVRRRKACGGCVAYDQRTTQARRPHATCCATYNVPHATHHATSGARCRLVSVLHRHRFLATIKLAANSLGDAEIVQVRPPSRIDSLPYEPTITVPHARPLLNTRTGPPTVYSLPSAAPLEPVGAAAGGMSSCAHHAPCVCGWLLAWLCGSCAECVCVCLRVRPCV